MGVFDPRYEYEPVTPVTPGGGGYRDQFVGPVGPGDSILDRLSYTWNSFFQSDDTPYRPDIPAPSGGSGIDAGTVAAIGSLRPKTSSPTYENPNVSVGFDPARQSEMLQQQLNDLYAQRAAAIRRSGSGAAAPYNAAIARIEQAISELATFQAEVPRVYGAFGGNIQAGYDEAVEKIRGYANMEQVYQQRIGEQARTQIEVVYSDAQNRVSNTMKSIGADAGSQAFVANMVGEMENDIMSWTEVTEKNAQRTAAAASRAAEAAARLGGATSAAEMKRNQILIELDLKERMKSLVEQKASTLASRSAAVSSARSQTAAAWEDILGQYRYPVGEDYTTFFQEQYLNEARKKFNLSPDDVLTINELMPVLYNSAYSQLDGLDPSKAFHQVRFLMSDPIGQAMLAGEGSGITRVDSPTGIGPQNFGFPEGGNPIAELFKNMTAKEFDTYAAIISEGIQLQYERQQHLDNIGSPSQYPLGSIDHAAASYAYDSMFLPLNEAQWWSSYKDAIAKDMASPSYASTPYTQTTTSKPKTTTKLKGGYY